MVYLVGYNQKQITNYIHKLNKEFKNLPYDYGAEFGYSMKIDEIKTIEDALNEATKVLKKQKEVNESYRIFCCFPVCHICPVTSTSFSNCYLCTYTCYISTAPASKHIT